MRRMTKVSPYPYWHFFDAYPPGYLRAVYRGNGIPLPWGNMAQASDPCPQWAVFRMLDAESAPASGSQLSVLLDGEQWLLYCCHSRRVADMAGNVHVLSVGIDLAPALRAHGDDAQAIVSSIGRDCVRGEGAAALSATAAQAITRAARVLNIAWIEDALLKPARVICPRSSRCQRAEPCVGACPSQGREITDVREEILGRRTRTR